MRRSDRDLVRALPLFRDTGEAHFDALMRAAFLQRFPSHVVLIEEGQSPDFLHIVIEGTVELFSRSAGRETTIDIIRPVTTFILAAVVSDQPYLNSVRTLSDSRVLLIPAQRVRAIFDQDVAFARVVAHELARAYRTAIKKLKGQMARSSIERLANWVLAEANRAASGTNVVIPFDRGTLASHIGTTRENLSRNLALLTEHGVRIRGREIVIDHKEQLEAFARPEPLIDDPST